MENQSNGNGWDKEKVIDKVRKLLALTSSPNENEAQVAATKAQELLTKYNLHMSEVTVMSELDKEQSKVTEKWFRYRAHRWEKDLAAGIAKYHYCRSIVHPYSKKFSFVGRQTNTDVAVEVFEWVMPQIARLAKAAGRERKRNGDHYYRDNFRVSYAFGLVNGVVERLREQFELQQQLNVKCTALVVSFRQENEDYIREQYRRLKRGSGRTNVNPIGFVAGRSDADKVSLSLRNQVQSKRQLR